jgi:hypothetical protein
MDHSKVERDGHRTGRRRRATAVAMAAVVALLGSACSKGRTGSGVVAYNVFVQQFRYHSLPSSIKTGNIQINFSNKETFPITHEMIMLQMPSGKTAQDIIDSAKVKGCEGGGPCEEQFLHFGEIAGVDTGATVSSVFDLPPGDYFVACWEKGTAKGTDDGPPHASIGMVYTFKVTP